MFLDMLEFLFGWRKASTCKKLIRYVQCRLKIMKSKRESIIRQIREVIVQLLKNGQDHRAFSRVEQLVKDQNMKELYVLLDNFCELIIIRLPYIRRHRDCPNDINEAVSSLIFASARFGDLPELIRLRKLFGKRYGIKLMTSAVELLSENHVNHEMIERLRMKSVPDDVKFRFLKEIARENSLQLSAPDTGCGLALQYYQAHEPEKQESNGDDVKDRPRSTSSPSTGLEVTLCQANVRHNTTNNYVGALTIVQPVPGDNVPPSCYPDCRSLIRVEQQANPSAQSDLKSCSSKPYAGATSSQHKVKRVRPSKHSQSSIAHVDDVQEFQPCEKEDIKSQDQRVFMFNLTFSSLRCKSRANTENAEVRKKSIRKRLITRYGSAESLVHIYTMLFFSRYLCFDYKGYRGSSLSKVSEQPTLMELSYCHSGHGECEDAAHALIAHTKGISSDSPSGEQRMRNDSTDSEILPCSTEIVPWTETSAETSSLYSNSSSSSSCSHIHPKLPDYDDIVTKFMALKVGHIANSSK